MKKSLVARYVAAVFAFAALCVALTVAIGRGGSLCGMNEPGAVCLRSWLGVVGPLVAVAALLVALRQFGLSRDTAERQLRAYIGVAKGSFRLVNVNGGGVGVLVHVQLVNSGKTPAYDFTTWINPPIAADSDASPFGEPLPIENRTSTSIVFADGEVDLQRAWPLAPLDLDAVRAGTRKFFVSGGADYRDAFGVRRTLKFYDVSGDEVNGVWPLKPHKRGYVAD